MLRFQSLVLGLWSIVFLFSAPVHADDFKREGKPAQRLRKDPLEGKSPPPLQVSGWMNTEGKSIDLKSLRGKVVVLKFWGVW